MKIPQALAGLTLAAVILAACQAPQPTATPTPEPSQPAAAVSPDPRPLKGDLALTFEEVSKHTTAEDCWMIISGKVYDVTPFIAGGKHPGGAAILAGCGMDATELFMTRPMGSGTAHSEKAQMNLPQYYLGEHLIITDAASDSAGIQVAE